MNIKNYVWTLPFLTFILGYSITQWFFHIEGVSTPHLIGKSVHEILPIVSEYRLNLRLINQKEDNDLAPGIILNQTPAPGTSIKPNQPLFIAITKNATALKAPYCIGTPIRQLIESFKEMTIHPRVYTIAHAYPEQICFAQWPENNEPLEKNKLIIYISAGNNKPIIWPNFVGLPIQEVEEFLSEHSIVPYIINDSMSLQNGIITDQRPQAGTLLTINAQQPLSVQLRIG